MFSLGGYIADVQNAEKASTRGRGVRAPSLPKGSDYREVLKVFPEPRLARKIFGTMENARIDSVTAVIRPYVEADPYRLGVTNMSAFDNNVNALKTFVTARQSSVNDQFST